MWYPYLICSFQGLFTGELEWEQSKMTQVPTDAEAGQALCVVGLADSTPRYCTDTEDGLKDQSVTDNASTPEKNREHCLHQTKNYF